MDSFTFVIFGITSNLAQIKLIPALYQMAEKGLLPPDFQIIGSARRKLTREEFENYINNSLQAKSSKLQIKKEILENLIDKMQYLSGNLDDPYFYSQLKQQIEHQNIIFYLATYPELYDLIFEYLNRVGLNKQQNGWIRLMIEKPIGTNLVSAQKLNQLLAKYFSEDQIFRLDHYLGKETIQNILAFRFGNEIFEPLINNKFVDHIQITSAEDFGIGKRGGYFDKVGALKDVGQNHLLQMLAFATMDAPQEFSNRAVTDARIKILKTLKPIPSKVVFGQYQGYLKEGNVNSKSRTDTFFAFKTSIENEKFKDVPIYIRAGKKLKQTITEIVIVFKKAENRLLKHNEPNILIYRIQPNEGIVLKILTKKPGHKIELQPDFMQFCYHLNPNNPYFPDPYEKLLIDTIRGDQTFFNDAQEVEAQWSFIDPLAATSTTPHRYKPGTWGPKEADELIERDGRKWLEPSMDFCRI